MLVRSASSPSFLGDGEITGPGSGQLSRALRTSLGTGPCAPICGSRPGVPSVSGEEQLWLPPDQEPLAGSRVGLGGQVWAQVTWTLIRLPGQTGQAGPQEQNARRRHLSGQRRASPWPHHMHRQLGTRGGWLWGTDGWAGGHLSNGHSVTSTVLAQVRVGNAGRAGQWQAFYVTSPWGRRVATVFAEHYSWLLLHRGPQGQRAWQKPVPRRQRGTKWHEAPQGICPRAERRECPDLHCVWGRPQVSDEKLTRGETWFGGEERLFEVRQMAHLFIFIRCFLNLCCGPSTVRSSRMKWADVAGAEAGGNQRTIPALSGPHMWREGQPHMGKGGALRRANR